MIEIKSKNYCVAETDIKCYKVYAYTDNNIISSLNKWVEISFDKKRTDKNTDAILVKGWHGTVFSKDNLYSAWLHSLDCNTVLETNLFKVFSCTIPKGSKYYVNVEGTKIIPEKINIGEIVSDDQIYSDIKAKNSMFYSMLGGNDLSSVKMIR